MKITKNFQHILRFELIRSLKKPSFWISVLIVPVLLVAYIAFAALMGINTEDAIDSNGDTSAMRIGIIDESNYLEKPSSFINAKGEQQNLTNYPTLDNGLSALKNDQLDLVYYLPSDFASSLTAQIYVKPDRVSPFADYSSAIKNLLSTTAASRIGTIDYAAATGAIQYTTTTLDADNATVDPAATFARMGVPALGVIAFYILIVVFGNRLTTAMVEEKENRISEMILTAVRPDDLILGKVVSLMLLGFIQLLALAAPIIILVATGLAKNIIPISLNIDWNPISIASTILLVVLSYFLFTALCVAIGTLTPTAKDAVSYSSVVVMLVILPVFFMSNFFAPTPDASVYILSYFPPSAPIALMFRNVVDTLPTWEYWLGIVDITICSLLVFAFAIHTYRNFAIEYTARVNLKNLLNKPRKTWTK